MMLSSPRRLGAVLSVLFLVSFAVTASAETCGGDRPCGPVTLTGPLKYLIPQEVGGADLRPACRRHDACYDTPGANKADCDRQFLADMECACKHSRHPLLCRFVARTMAKVTRKHGDDSFNRAQMIAMATR